MPTEYTIQLQEQQIPQLATIALHEAGQSALESGYRVLTMQQDQLIEISLDGEVTIYSQLHKSIPVKRGQLISRSA